MREGGVLRLRERGRYRMAETGTGSGSPVTRLRVTGGSTRAALGGFAHKWPPMDH